MRLRYLRVGAMPPLVDVPIKFGHEPVPDVEKQCAIHFVVGVNGSGKSRLLQALTEIFLRLERQELPPFPVTLAYDLGRPAPSAKPEDSTLRTIYFYYPGPLEVQRSRFERQASLDGDDEPGEMPEQKLALVKFKHIALEIDVNWDALTEVDWVKEQKPFGYELEVYNWGDLPGSGSIATYLPDKLLAYTSGATADWQELFSPRHTIKSLLEVSEDIEVDTEQERPLDWDETKELVYSYQNQEAAETVTAPPTAEQKAALEPNMSPDTSSIGIFVSPADLKLALCAVTLAHAVEDFKELTDAQTEVQFLDKLKQEQLNRNAGRVEGLRGILNEVDWDWLVTIGLHINFRPESFDRYRDHQTGLTDLYNIAQSVLGNPNYPDRQLFFDLRASQTANDKLPGNVAAALFEVLSGENREPTPLEVFSRLARWKKEGLLNDVSLIFRRRDPERNDSDKGGYLLTYESLSDGERVFLGRMALFYLLANTDNALILLDEPETHFNDVWKREIVSIIDSSLSNNATDVMIATHSSIALSDVFKWEIELLRKNLQTGETKAVEPGISTFGADPGEILVQVFGANDSIGQRSLSKLNELLEKDWQSNDIGRLETLIRAVGFGYYRSELRTIWRNLNATQS